MNVYDFDDTILSGDAEVYFISYMKRVYPSVKKRRFEMAFYCGLQKAGILPREFSRRKIYSFLADFDNISAIVEDFRQEHFKFIKPFYYDLRRDDDLIISGTPEFLLAPVVKKLGVTHLIATQMDSKTGEINGKWNYGMQKVINFRKEYGDISPERFYSDSISDEPMVRISISAFRVRGQTITPWKTKGRN